MCAFALLAEQAEQLDRLRPGGREPVRDPGVELGSLTGLALVALFWPLISSGVGRLRAAVTAPRSA